MASELDKANYHISGLLKLTLPDDLPNLEPAHQPVCYSAAIQTGFKDLSLFIGDLTQIGGEASAVAQFENLIERGDQLAAFIYTWRCLTKAFPQVSDSRDSVVNSKIYQLTVDTLKPDIERLYELREFVVEATRLFVSQVSQLSGKEKHVYVSELFLFTLAKILNIFVVLDELKNIKASIKNDHSTYRRAAQHLGLLREPKHLELSNTMTIFIAQNNSISNTLKDELRKIPDHEELLCDIANKCADLFERKRYVLPSEKSALLMALAFALHLIDTTSTKEGAKAITIYKLDAQKKLSLKRFDDIFYQTEVCCLFGDMQLSPFQFYCKNNQYYKGQESSWPKMSQSASMQAAFGSGLQANLALQQAAAINHGSGDQARNKLCDVVKLRHEFRVVAGALSRVINEWTITSQYADSLSNAQADRIYSTALTALRQLSSWTTTVMEVFAWKLNFPTDSRLNASCPSDAEDYAKRTTYNYSPAEKAALVELIGTIKATQALLARTIPVLQDAVNRRLYRRVQKFAQCTVPEPLNKLKKSKRHGEVERLLNGLRQSLLDFPDGRAASQNLSSALNLDGDDSRRQTQRERPFAGGLSSVFSKNKKKAPAQQLSQQSTPALSGDEPMLRNSPVPPSRTQVFLLRAILDLFVSDRSPMRKAIKKDIGSDTSPGGGVSILADLKRLYEDSFWWPYMLDLSTTVVECCDLSQLWYREFYLEIAHNVRIQFPIEMSLPWLLTSHILDFEQNNSVQHELQAVIPQCATAAALAESLLFTLDLYNDSAMYALTRFRRRHLYIEIEAEVNLAFEQLLFILTEVVFSHYKRLAACSILDKRLRYECNRLGIVVSYPYAARFVALVRQTHFQLLGRSVNLNRLLSQRLDAKLRKSLRFAVDLFHDTQPLSAVYELATAIELNRQCHTLLSEMFALQRFEDLLGEICDNVTTDKNRLTLKIFKCIYEDVLPNYAYNATTRRFVPGVSVSSGAQGGNDASTNSTRNDAEGGDTGEGQATNSQDEFRFVCDDTERRILKKTQPSERWGSPELCHAYDAIFTRWRGFIGPEHFASICQLLGYRGVAIVTSDLMRLAAHIIGAIGDDSTDDDDGDESDDVMGDGLPQSDAKFLTTGEQLPLIKSMSRLFDLLKKPRLLKDSGEFRGAKPIDVLAELQSDLHDALLELGRPEDSEESLWSTLRQLGNCVAVIFTLEEALHNTEFWGLFLSGPFRAVLPSPVVKNGQTPQDVDKLRHLQKRKYQNWSIHSVVNEFGTPAQKETYKDALLITRERMCCGLSLKLACIQRMERVLLRRHRLTNAMSTPGGHSTQKPGRASMARQASTASGAIHQLSNTDYFVAFQPVFSAILFAVCLPSDAAAHDRLFGDSVLFAGSLLMHLAKKRRRFELNDFSWRVVEVQTLSVTAANEKTPGTSKGVDMKTFITRAKLRHRSIVQWFDQFDCARSQRPRSAIDQPINADSSRELLRHVMQKHGKIRHCPVPEFDPNSGVQ